MLVSRLRVLLAGLMATLLCLAPLADAEAATARIKRTLLKARTDTAKARRLGLETADIVLAVLENRKANTVSDSPDEPSG